MTPSPQESSLDSPRGFRAPGTARMIAGSLLGAVAAYLFQVIGGRRLGTTAFAPVAILWTVFFIVATVILIPLEQFVTREVSRGRRILVDDRRILVLVILGTGLGMSTFVYLTRNLLFSGQALFAVQAGLMAMLFGSMPVGKGLLAGHRKFAQYGAVLALEGIFRLAAAIVLLGISASASALAWAMVCAPLGAFLLRPWRFDRETVTGVDPTPAGGFLANYVVGSSASQLLLAGAPLGVVALGGNEHLRSVIFATFTLYRAPLTLIYNLQGRILSLLVRNNGHDQVRRLVSRVTTRGIALVGLAGMVGWVAGPAVVEILFGSEFRPQAIVAGLVAAGVIAASLTQILSQALVANGSISELAGSWVGGLIAGIAAMTLSRGQPDFRVAVGFIVGELVAFTLACWRTIRKS